MNPESRENNLMATAEIKLMNEPRDRQLVHESLHHPITHDSQHPKPKDLRIISQLTANEVNEYDRV
jgi:hypothetical protein